MADVQLNTRGASILTALTAVDGPGSGLNVDMVDGLHSGSFVTSENPVFTGTVTVPDGALAIADTNGLQPALDAKANAANPVFTGTVTVPDGALAIVDTSGLQAALDAKATAANPVFTGTVTVPDGALAIADTSGLQTALDAKALLTAPAVAFAPAAANLAGKASQYLRVNSSATLIESVAGSATGTDASLSNYTRAGTGGVTRTVKAVLDERIISVKDFGAVGDGVANDTAAFTAAFNAIMDMPHPSAGHVPPLYFEQSPNVTGGVIFIPPGLYRIKNWTIDKGCTVIGTGRATRLMPTSDALPTDYIMKVMRKETAGANYRNENHFPYAVLQDFMFDGRGRSIATNGLALDRADHMRLESLVFDEIDGIGLDCIQSVRESTFYDLRFRYCGNATSPQVSLVDMGTTLDCHNSLHFIGGGFVYPLGHNVKIASNPANPSGPIRNIFFNNLLCHGRNPTAPTTPRPVANRTRHFLLGEHPTAGASDVSHVFITNCRIHAWASGEGAIHIANGSDVMVTGCNFSRAYADDGSFTGPDATTPHCRITVAGARLQACNNYFEQRADSIMIVDRPGAGASSTHRHFGYTDI